MPRPVNLPSLRREHAGNDPSIALVGGSGSGAGWTKAAPVQEDMTPAVVVSTPETTPGMCVFFPAAEIAFLSFVNRSGYKIGDWNGTHDLDFLIRILVLRGSDFSV